MTFGKDLKAALAKPFPASDVEWRIARSGMRGTEPWAKCLAYITARAVQERLDDVMGPENWKDEYEFVYQTGEGGKVAGVMCTLSLKIGEEWISKQNGSDPTDIEAFKGGISKALVRTASTWGIGRYLYDLTESWAKFTDNKDDESVKIDNKWFHWRPPTLPAWALPTNTPRAPQQDKPAQSAPAPAAKPAGLAPVPGRDQFALQREIEEAMKTLGMTNKQLDDYCRKTHHCVPKELDLKQLKDTLSFLKAEIADVELAAMGNGGEVYE